MKNKSYKHLWVAGIALIYALGICKAQEQEPSQLLDFWVGNWEVSWDEGDGKRGSGTNRIEKILGGTVIQENFEGLEGNYKGFKGTSLSVYVPRLKQWKQAWADNQGGYFSFDGNLSGDTKTFQTVIKETADGKKVTQRMVFYNITENALTWDWESSTDGGKTWTLNWRIDYKRKEQ